MNGYGKLNLVLIMPVLTAKALGCTSFAVYSSDRPIFGMNFDWYPESEIIFDVSDDSGGASVFTMSFRDGDSDPVPTVGMNEDGIFITMQVIDDSRGTGEPGEGEAMIWSPFYYGLWEADDYGDIAQYLQRVRLVQYTEIPLHLLVADGSGNAMVVEVGEVENSIVGIGTDDYIVMTNFSNSASVGVPPEQVTGCGADRYAAAAGALEASASGLDPVGAMKILEAALNNSEGFPTRVSMVFDPHAGRILVALDGDMERLWRIDMDGATVRGVRGLPQDLLYSLPEDGITSEELGLRVEGGVF